MLKIDGQDDAVLGTAWVWTSGGRHRVLVYDAEKICASYVRDGMTEEEAREFLEVNVEGAYVGPTTPVVVWLGTLDEEEECC